MTDFSLFLLPFLTGLALVLILPVLGAYLRLRNEWLAALSYPHVAAAGALLATLLGGPAMLGGMLAAGVAGGGKRFVARRLSGDASYALLLLASWATSILVTANEPLAERLGHALFDGQLYFSGLAHALWAAGAALLAAWVLFKLSRLLLLARLYPDFFASRGLRSWSIDVGFDLLVALFLALATLLLGVMATFTLVFVPPWLAFRRQSDWRSGLRFALGFSVLAYLLGFAVALHFDQPFGATFTILQIVMALIVA